MTRETLKNVGALLKPFLFLIGAIILLLGLYRNFIDPPANIVHTAQGTQIVYDYGQGNTSVAVGLGMLATAAVWWIVDMQRSISQSQIPDGTLRCPHCGAEVVPYKRPEPFTFREGGEVTFICLRCGKRI